MLEGLTTVIAAFFVFCLYRQDMIKNRTYYYATFICLVGIVFFGTLIIVAGSETYLRGFAAIMSGIFQIAALVLTLAYVGGVTVREIAGEMKEAAEDFRTGGQAKKPVIVPLTGAQPAPRAEPASEPEEKPRIVIELPKKPDDKGSLPVE